MSIIWVYGNRGITDMISAMFKYSTLYHISFFLVIHGSIYLDELIQCSQNISWLECIIQKPKLFQGKDCFVSVWMSDT